MELCLHSLLKNGLVLGFVTLLGSIKEHVHAAHAVVCLLLKMRSVGGKLHGLVVLVGWLEQVGIFIRKRARLYRLAPVGSLRATACPTGEHRIFCLASNVAL